MKLSKEAYRKLFYIISSLIAAIGVAFGLTSCGVTKATISRPAEGTSTTITITTNNPITTNVDPTTNVDFNKTRQ